MKPHSLIEAAIRLLGSEAKLGAACGVTQGAIWKAKRAGRVSGELAVKIERATEKSITRRDLRPDLWDASTQEDVTALLYLTSQRSEDSAAASQVDGPGATPRSVQA
ncbi:transcriptional regulator [Methylobacterium sp. J-068]|uniref:transcriptional regulator n=1 Tax=Methylobacterium sp. J-068 TaxID=2836649 RepID=UPI00391DE2C8